MALEMLSRCQSCKALVTPEGTAFICSYECTFCPTCAGKINGICPNCGGELVHRPRRRVDAYGS